MPGRSCFLAPDLASSLVIDEMRLILTRQRLDSEILAQRLTAMDHSVLIEPMLTIHPCPDTKLELDQAAAILLTSANGARALACHTADRQLPVLCVGDATAHAAQDAGFKNISSANGDVTALMALARQRVNPSDGALVHVAGSSVAGDLAGDLTAHGYQVQRANLYRAETARQLSHPCQDALRTGDVDGILFFSPRSAATFVKLLQQEELVEVCRDIELFGLSRAVADAAAGAPWKGQNIAAKPRQDGLLELLQVNKN